MHERVCHEHAWFTTLTYSDANLPANGSLNIGDIQKFLKRLRRKREDDRIAYYICGEYGPRTKRPHYHAVFFGTDFLDRYPHPSPSRHNVFRSKALDDTWGHGHTELAPLSQGAAYYAAAYSQKKLRARDWSEADPQTGEVLQQEFALMSRNPAIGRTYIQRYWRDIYPRDYVALNGYHFQPPRYYDKWMDENYPFIMEWVRDARWQKAERIEKKKLADMAEIHHARINLKLRDAI